QLTARTAPLAKAARMASGGSPPHPPHRVDLSLEGEVTGGEAMPLRYPSLWGRDNAGPGEDAYPLVEMPLLDQALCLQPVGRDGGGGFAAHLYAAVQRLQGLEVELGEHRLQQVLDLRVLLQHRLADDRGRVVDRLHALVVDQRHEIGRGDAAIGAVDHGGVGA